MKFSWDKALSIGFAVLNTVVPGVSAVEVIARQIPALRGKAKQDAVVEMVRQSLSAAEGFVGKDLVEDAAVEQATRGVIDAVVALNNILATKRAAAGV